MSSSLSVLSTTAHIHRNKPHHPHHHQHMDRMDAARALLGVAPPSSSSSKQEASPEEDDNASSLKTSRLSTPSSVSFKSFTFGASSANTTSILTPCLSAPASRFNPRTGTFEPIAAAATTSTPSKQKQAQSQFHHNQKPNSLSPLAAAAEAATSSSARTTPANAALDALAALASCERDQQPTHCSNNNNGTVVSSSASASCSSDEDTTNYYFDNDMEAMPPPPPRTCTTAVRLLTRGRRRAVSNPEGMEKWEPPSSLVSRRYFVLPACILEEELAEASAAMEAHNEHQRLKKTEAAPQRGHEEFLLSSSPSSSLAPISGLMSEEEQANLTPEELLRKARSRLLEDLSEGTLNGEKGVLTLPHSLNKYKEVYNKNGRIGIYTPAERSAIIARFQSKRSRRVWNKKIRYNCRKNLADRRMRVKGRFVKRSTEQQPATPSSATSSKSSSPVPAVVDEGSVLEEPLEDTRLLGTDEDMPDVNDPEAGFCPTDDQPYRRTRRHTIT